MKKILALSALGCLLGTAVQAQQKDIYINGSSAFRVQAYNSVKALYSTLTSENAGSAAVSSGNSLWTMSGQMSSIFGSQTVVVHAVFNGSVQGIHSLYDPTDKKVFLKNATSGDTTLTTNTASLAFTDVDSSSTAYPLSASSFIERYVAIQPFCYVRSLNCPASVTNITIQQLQQFMPNGYVKLSYLTGNPNDAGTNVYLLNRSLDSGTRVAAYADAFVTASSPTIYYWQTNGGVANFYLATNNLGPAIYGYGYVGGGDVKNQLIAGGSANANNISIGYLGLSDARGVNGGQNILSYNGAYPSTDIKTGASVPALPTYDSCRNGTYSYWAYEVVAQPKTPGGDNTINGTDLTAFTRKLCGYDSSNPENFVGGTGSVDYDISLLVSGKNAVRLGDMNVLRTSVGGPIAP